MLTVGHREGNPRFLGDLMSLKDRMCPGEELYRLLLYPKVEMYLLVATLGLVGAGGGREVVSWRRQAVHYDHERPGD